MVQKLGNGIAKAMRELGKTVPSMKTTARISQVKSEYQAAIEWVYKDGAALFLEHTNSVYITDKNEVKTLIVYTDESIFAAELNAQREIIKEWLNQTYQEHIEVFEIHISRGSYKKQHPFQNVETAPSKKPVHPLTKEQEKAVEYTASAIDDMRMKKAFVKVMTADLKRQN